MPSQELQSQDAVKGLHVRGNFIGNTALNTGAGARGGALRILNVNASVTLDGLFKNNFADERGAVLAVNWVSAVCSVETCPFVASGHQWYSPDSGDTDKSVLFISFSSLYPTSRLYLVEQSMAMCFWTDVAVQF